MRNAMFFMALALSGSLCYAVHADSRSDKPTIPHPIKYPTNDPRTDAVAHAGLFVPPAVSNNAVSDINPVA